MVLQEREHTTEEIEQKRALIFDELFNVLWEQFSPLEQREFLNKLESHLEKAWETQFRESAQNHQLIESAYSRFVKKDRPKHSIGTNFVEEESKFVEKQEKQLRYGKA